MSDQSEREAYNEAAREYHEGKDREEMDRPMFTQRDMDAAVQGEREACARVAEGGSFLHSDSPEARFGKECAAAIRRRTSPAVDVLGVVREYVESSTDLDPERGPQRYREALSALTALVPPTTTSDRPCTCDHDHVEHDEHRPWCGGPRPTESVLDVVRRYVKARRAYDAAWLDFDAINDSDAHSVDPFAEELGVAGEALAALVDASPKAETKPRGVWRCECCGEMFDGISPEWRMSAGQMAHKCPGNDPQAGYFTARFFPDARPAVDVISEDFAVTMKTIATVYEERDRVMAVVREWRDAEAEWVAVHENPSTVFNDERRERIIAVNDRHARSRIALRALVDGKGEAKDGDKWDRTNEEEYRAHVEQAKDGGAK